MKSTLSIADLSKALSMASRCIAKRTTLPVLSCVRVQATQDHLLISATDLDRFVTIKIPAEVQKPGSFVCSVSRLKMAISERADKVSLACDGKKLTVISTQGMDKTATIMVAPEEDWISPFLGHEGGSPILAGDFKTGLERASASVDSLVGRDAISCLRIHSSKGVVKFVGTNGRALTVHEWEHVTWEQESGSLSLASVSDLLFFLPDEGEVTIRIDEKTCSFSTPEITYACKILDIPYPNWEGVLNRPDPGLKVKLEREPLLRLFQEVASLDVGDQQMSGGRVKWVCDGQALKLSAESNADEIMVNLKLLDKCKPHAFALNGPLFLRNLKAMEADEVTLMFADEVSQFMLTCGETEMFMTPMRNA